MNDVIVPDFSELDKVNDKLMERVDAIHAALKAGVKRKDDLYRLLAGMLGEPTCTQFKVEFRNGRQIVVGGRMVFKGDEISRDVAIDENELSIRGTSVGSASESFGSFDDDDKMSPFQLALVEMFGKMYATSAIDANEPEGSVGDDARRISELLAMFGVNVKVEKVHRGPTLNKIEVSLPPGCRYGSVAKFEDELQGALKKRSIRIEAPIPGSDTIGIEYDRSNAEPVTFAETTLPEIVRLDALRRRSQVPVVVGKDVDGSTVSFDLATLPHLLIGGATGQGKTVFLHGLINGIVSSRSPEEVRLILVDPKCVEFVAYANLPHLVMPVVNDNAEMAAALGWAAVEMKKRLETFASAGVRNIQDYNNREIKAVEKFKEIPETVPYVVIVMDEFADLLQSGGDEVAMSIARLTAMAGVTGIHLVLASQCSSSNVVTGTLKANIPGRIAFKTWTSLDSRVVLDDAGAERLMGEGDCLYRDREGILQRVQVPFISDEEIAANVERAIARYSV